MHQMHLYMLQFDVAKNSILRLQRHYVPPMLQYRMLLKLQFKLGIAQYRYVD